MVARKYLCFGLITCFLVIVSGVDDATFTQHGKQIKFLGKSAKFEITTGNSSMRLSFGAIQELDANGAPVNGRKIVELASIQPVFQQGMCVIDWIGQTAARRVSLCIQRRSDLVVLNSIIRTMFCVIAVLAPSKYVLERTLRFSDSECLYQHQ